MHCFIVRLEEDLDAAVAEHREYLQRQQSYSVHKRGEIPLAEAARDLMRRGLRKKAGGGMRRSKTTAS
jgi:hypothetical protein